MTTSETTPASSETVACYVEREINYLRECKALHAEVERLRAESELRRKLAIHWQQIAWQLHDLAEAGARDTMERLTEMTKCINAEHS